LRDDSELTLFLRPSDTIDSDHDAIRRFAAEAAAASAAPVEKAVHLFYAVRDGIRYDPYTIDLTAEGLRASTTLAAGRGWCVPKAVLLAAACRAANIPARLGFADVRNHLSTARMRAQMQTDVFFWHGYTSIYLNGAWLKATPAFNIELCEKFRLKPLEFDGKSDAIYHAFDLDGNRHMDYIGYRGEFVDVPIARIRETFREKYTTMTPGPTADFDADVAVETVRRGE
jgi:transglutaminase-like putative cysteine protease